MNTFQSSNRNEVRATVAHLNNALGRKAFVQPRTKNGSGLWEPMHKGGVIKCPPKALRRLSLPSRSKRTLLIVGGASGLVSAQNHANQAQDHALQTNSAMAQAFNRAMH